MRGSEPDVISIAHGDLTAQAARRQSETASGNSPRPPESTVAPALSLASPGPGVLASTKPRREGPCGPGQPCRSNSPTGTLGATIMMVLGVMRPAT